MNGVFFGMIWLGFLYAAFSGNWDAAAQSVLNAGDEAIRTTFELCGAFMFFGGISSVLEKCGASKGVVRVLKGPLRKLFGVKVREDALAAVSMNMAANLLGMGNAATPMGLRAARLLNPNMEMRAPAALCLLLVLNSTAIELFPATVLAMRYAAGSQMPGAIILPTFVSTCASCFVGVILCRICERSGG